VGGQLMPVSGQIGPAFESTFLIDADNVIGQREEKKKRKKKKRGSWILKML